MRLILLLTACLQLTISPRAVDRTIDGDTFILFSVGVPAEERVRVLGIDTPERNAAKFEEAKAFTSAWLAQGPFTIAACKRDSFGRLLASVTRGTENLADALFNAGLGVRR